VWVKELKQRLLSGVHLCHLEYLERGCTQRRKRWLLEDVLSRWRFTVADMVTKMLPRSSYISVHADRTTKLLSIKGIT